ncbi:MAG: hypothetical protein Q7T55_02560 [Solirubrobacteraceae bacterium]|nr:hypothetical protein [Solirubrobacteraceae bacterium]
MPTVRELAAESIGRITRRGLEPQIAQLEAALDRGELPIAMAPGRDGAVGVVVLITRDRLLVSAGAPFTQPALATYLRDAVVSAAAAPGEDAWTLSVEFAAATTEIHGMFDRDAQRFAGFLT